MARDGKILHIEESGEYIYAIDKQTVLDSGIQVLGPVAQDLLLLILMVEETGDQIETTYTFTWEGKTHTRRIRIRPAASPWAKREAAAVIRQHCLNI